MLGKLENCWLSFETFISTAKQCIMKGRGFRGIFVKDFLHVSAHGNWNEARTTHFQRTSDKGACKTVLQLMIYQQLEHLE